MFGVGQMYALALCSDGAVDVFGLVFAEEWQTPQQTLFADRALFLACRPPEKRLSSSQAIDPDPSSPLLHTGCECGWNFICWRKQWQRYGRGGSGSVHVGGEAGEQKFRREGRGGGLVLLTRDCGCNKAGLTYL